MRASENSVSTECEDDPMSWSLTLWLLLSTLSLSLLEEEEDAGSEWISRIHVLTKLKKTSTQSGLLLLEQPCPPPPPPPLEGGRRERRERTVNTRVERHMNSSPPAGGCGPSCLEGWAGGGMGVTI